MLVLLDENLPHRLRLLIPGHDVRTVDYQGWKSLSNGALLKAAEDAGFDVMVTADKGILYQQNLGSRNIAIVILSTNELELVVEHVDKSSRRSMRSRSAVSSPSKSARKVLGIPTLTLFGEKSNAERLTVTAAGVFHWQLPISQHYGFGSFGLLL